MTGLSPITLGEASITSMHGGIDSETGEKINFDTEEEMLKYKEESLKKGD